ncbi:MAG: radical SAM protein [Desulfobacteraceae bacterium]
MLSAKSDSFLQEMMVDRPKVVIVAANQALSNDIQIRRRMRNEETWAERQSHRFPDLDLLSIQKGVHQNMLRLVLHLNGYYMDLFDLMNFSQNGHRLPELTPENVNQYYSLANSVTLNGIYLYQHLLKAGYDPIVIQNYATANLPDILQEKPLAVCISSNFMFMDDIGEVAAHVKACAHEIPVIAGGMLVKRLLDPGESLSPQALRSFSAFHGKVDAFVVEAQGEQSLVELLQAYRCGNGLEGVPNLAFYDKRGEMRFTPRQTETLPMDHTAIAWDEIPKDYLRNTLPVSNSRGCFYRCRFCTYHWLFPKVHYKSLGVLKEELRRIQGLGFVKHVRFTDDNFTAKKERFKDVLEMMIEEDFDFGWSSYARASALSPELVGLMKASGCEFVDLGIESGSQVILDHMDKRLNREQALQAIKMLNDHGIYSRGSFIIGYPGETEETFSDTIEFINESALPYYSPYLFSYSKRSLVHEEAGRFGLRGIGRAWRHDTMDAVEASRLMSQMPIRIPKGFADGLANIEEIYRLLRGKEYAPETIWEIFRLKRELQLSGKKSPLAKPFSLEMIKILQDLKALIN